VDRGPCYPPTWKVVALTLIQGPGLFSFHTISQKSHTADNAFHSLGSFQSSVVSACRTTNSIILESGSDSPYKAGVTGPFWTERNSIPSRTHYASPTHGSSHSPIPTVRALCRIRSRIFASPDPSGSCDGECPRKRKRFPIFVPSVSIGDREPFLHAYHAWRSQMTGSRTSYPSLPSFQNRAINQGLCSHPVLASIRALE
jgi:hypothetical protein